MKKPFNNGKPISQAEYFLLKENNLIDEDMIYFVNDTSEYLERLKEILTLYATSKIGTEQPDGTYKIDSCGNALIGSFNLISNPFGLPSTVQYDPRPAKEGLEILERIM